MEEIGLACNQAHAPFDFNLDRDVIDPANKHYREVIKSMEVAAILGADHIVVHPLTPADEKTVLEVNETY